MKEVIAVLGFSWGCLNQDPSPSKAPPELQSAYDRLVKAFEAADVREINRCPLLGAVTIVDTERKENREYGPDINLPFLKKGFDKKILSVTESGDGTYLIRTSSTYLRFVLYRNEWKLYRYGDKPSE